MRILTTFKTCLDYHLNHHAWMATDHVLVNSISVDGQLKSSRVLVLCALIFVYLQQEQGLRVFLQLTHSTDSLLLVECFLRM